MPLSILGRIGTELFAVFVGETKLTSMMSATRQPSRASDILRQSATAMETQQIPYHLAVFSALVVGTAIGSFAGSRLRGPESLEAPGT